MKSECSNMHGERIKIKNIHLTYYCHLRKWVSRQLATVRCPPTAAGRRAGWLHSSRLVLPSCVTLLSH